MLAEKNIQTLIDHLVSGSAVAVQTHDSHIFMHYLDEHAKLSLSTSVFDGGNYIPKSVRQCIEKKITLKSSLMRTFITVDEERFSVKLNYLGHAEELNQNELTALVDAFDEIAEKWRCLLNEKGNNDLIYVKVK